MSNLKFLLDENIPKSIMNFLKSKRVSVEYVPGGVKNSRVAKIAIENKAILVTRDSDFANTLVYPPEKFYGIIVLQIHPPKSELLVKALSNFMEEIDDFRGKLFVIDREGFKVIE